MANLTPIVKGKQSNITSNYRPISLLSCLGKVFERCVFKYTFSYLRDQRISMNQSGSIPGDSTVKAYVKRPEGRNMPF